MRVLLDEHLDHDLIPLFEDAVETDTLEDRGWKGLENGALFRAADEAFDAFVTMDKSIPHRRNLDNLQRMGVVLIRAVSNRYADVAPLMSEVNQALRDVRPGKLIRVSALD